MQITLEEAKRRRERVAKKDNTFDFDAETGDIFFDGYFGLGDDEIDSRGVRAALKKIGKKDITVYINSGGGSVTEGFAIYRLFEEHAKRNKVTTVVASLAASMGSLILQVGTKRVSHSAGSIMLHSPWTRTKGNAHDLKKEVEVLEKMQGQLVEIYARRSGKSIADMQEIMNAETWLTAREALAAGFIDAISGEANAMSLIEAKRRALACRRSPTLTLAAAKSRIAITKARLTAHEAV